MPKAGQYKKRGQPTKSTMEKAWRYAIREIWHHQCAFRETGDCWGPLEAHHVKRRAKGVLSYDKNNGILLCKKHHDEADYTEGRNAVEAKMDMKYLDAMDRYLLKDYLQERGLSRGEFLRGKLDELKRIARFGR